jgi:hypothetical protein
MPKAHKGGTVGMVDRYGFGLWSPSSYWRFSTSSYLKAVRSVTAIPNAKRYQIIMTLRLGTTTTDRLTVTSSVFDTSRKVHHWGRRKLARDQ